MATSILTGGGIVQFASALYGTDDDPMDTVIMRDGVMHGLHHAADSMAQVRVNYCPVDSGVAVDQDSYETIDSSPTAGQWYLVGGSPFGNWPLTMRADGSPYKLRVRVGGAVSATPATATFRVIIAPVRRLGPSYIDQSIDSIFQVTTTSSTAAWLSGTSQGTIGSNTLITVSASEARGWTRDVGIYDAVSEATPGTIHQVQVAAHVYAKTTVSGRNPLLYHLHVQEFVG